MVNTKAVIASTLGLVALGGATPCEATPTVKWEACPSPIPKNVDCAQIEVPVDYANPKAHKPMVLGMVRLKATGSKPKGNLFINPGGPGGSAVAMLVAQDLITSQSKTAFGYVSRELNEHYNLIGLDPRGVGLSNPVKCDAELWNKRVPNHVDTEEEYEALLKFNKELGESCLKMTGPSLEFLDTKSTVRDHDMARQALGDKKFNYLGLSYGSQIGTEYAQDFPENVGLMALDGITDHGQREILTMLTESATYEATLDKFFEWCAADETCALHSEKNLPALFDALITRANKVPLKAPGCDKPSVSPFGFPYQCRTDVTGWELLTNVQEGLAFPKGLITGEGWVQLSEHLKQAFGGNATALSQQLATTNVSTIAESIYPAYAIACLDWVHDQTSYNQYKAMGLAANAFAPHTHGATQSWDIETRCIGWPGGVRDPQKTLDNKALQKAAPVLLVTSYWDPETSISWAVDVRSQMPHAVSVFRDGAGHTSYAEYGDAQKAIDKFFIDGTWPVDGTVYKS